MRWLALLLCLAAPVAAQEYADAEGEMARAAEAYRQGNYRAALVHYGAAQKLAPDKPGPFLWLGLTHAVLGECAEAIPYLEEYLKRKAVNPKPEAMRTLAECKSKTQAAPGRALVTSDPPGAEVRIDDEHGAPVGVTPLEVATLSPELHRVFVRKAGFRAARGEIKIVPGMIATVALKLEPELVQQPLPPPPPPRPERRKSRAWIAGVVVGGAAVVALAVGLGVGLGVHGPMELAPIP